MSSESDIMDILYDWVVAKSGLASDRIVWAFQNQPRPTRPYALLRMFNDAPLKWTSEQIMSDSGSPGYGLEILNTGSFVLSIFVIGQTGIDTVPKDTMRTLRDSLEDEEVGRSLRREQINTVRVSTVAAGTNYTITVNDVDVTVNSGVAPTAQTIRDALVAALNSTNVSNPWVGYLGLVRAVVGGSTDTLLVYADKGYEFNVVLGSRLTQTAYQGAVDLAYRMEYGINDLTAILETKSEKRIQMDVRFGMSLRSYKVVDAIEHVEAEVNDLSFTVDAP